MDLVIKLSQIILLDMFLLLLFVIILEPHDIKRSKTLVAEKIDFSEWHHQFGCIPSRLCHSLLLFFSTLLRLSRVTNFLNDHSICNDNYNRSDNFCCDCGDCKWKRKIKFKWTFKFKVTNFLNDNSICNDNFNRSDNFCCDCGDCTWKRKIKFK